ncbi:MAG TPA: PD-(D/E)XK nuclease family protein, partial [Spirochaetales bacterium]|nr:PD-(D/E)XK nuclease family protein [Spirochaetales bacterium]
MQLLQSIKQYIEKRDTIFVFPSEIASRFWLKRSFSFTHRRTLSHERFISWDHFKKTTFKYSLPGLQPANEEVRTLFLHHLLDQNREKSFFRSIIPGEYAEYSPLQITALRKILPCLNRISEIPRLDQGIDAGKKKDLQLLLDKYLEFLEAGRLFEPGYKKPCLEVNNLNYLIFYPEILADFHYLNRKGWLSNHPEIKIISLTDEAPGPELKLTSFENSEEELTRVLLKIGALLDRQVDPGEIAISVPDLEELESPLLLLSRLHEVPLQIHQSKPLLRYPQARLFSDMKSCIDSGFSIESLKALLLNRAVPWKKEELNRKLIRFAVYYRIFRNYSTPSVKIDLWQENIKKALASSEPQGGFEPEEIEEIDGYFKRLKNNLEAIAESRNFTELKKKLSSFSGSFLSTADFNEDELKVFKFSLKALNELIIASARCNSRRVSSPFAIWVAYLEEKPYAPVDLSPGIAVYPYRLAAGICSRYHFIINACQSATECIIRPYPFLNIHEEYNLADILSTLEYDLSAPFIRLYSLSGEEVSFSYARKSYSGNSLPPALFVTSGAISNFSEKDEERLSDPYGMERALWSKEQVARPKILYHGQLQGLHRAVKTSLKVKSLNLWHTPLGQEQKRSVINRRLRYRDGYLVISPSSLEQYDNCAFNFLLDHGLAIDEESYLAESWEARETGNILHEIYLRFYQWVIEQGGYLERDHFTLYQVQLKDITHGVLESYGRNQPLPLFPLWQEKCRNIESLALALLEVDMKKFPEQRIIDVEKLLTVPLKPECRKVKLTGRIDRIAVNSKGMGVVDYKKSKTPKSRDIFAARPTSFQIPFYILLLTESGRNADWAAYYSIEEKKYIMVLDNEPELQEYAGRNLAETIEGMIENIENGDFTMATTAKKINCRFCPYPGICRHNFI